MTKQKLEWARLDRGTPINCDGDHYSLLLQHTTEGIAVGFKVGMSVEDVIGALRHAAALLEHRCGVEPTAEPFCDVCQGFHEPGKYPGCPVRLQSVTPEKS